MKSIWKRENIAAGTILFLTSLLFYGKQITGILANPDAIWNGTLYKSDWRWETSLNRFVIKWLQDIKFHVVNTTVASITCLFLLCLGTVLLTEILDISSLGEKLLTGFLILLSVNTGCLLTYYYCSDMYALSFLCIVGAAYLALKRDGIGTGIVSILLIVIGLGIYQAYVVSLLTLLLLRLFQEILYSDAKNIIRRSVRSVSIVVAGLLGYLAASKVVLAAYQVKAEEGRGFSSMGILEVGKTIRKIIESYYYFLQYYFGTSMINNAVGGRRGVHLVYFILLFILLLICIRNIRDSWRRVAIVAVALLMPVSIMCIHVLAPEVSILSTTGALMLPAMSYIYIVGILIITYLKSKYLKYAVIVAEGLVLFTVLTLNLAGQTYLEYSNEKAEDVAGEMASAVENAVDNSREYKLCIVGNMESGNYSDELAELRENLNWATYSYGAVWSDYSGAQGCWIELLKRVSGRSYGSCSNDEFIMLKESGMLDDMVAFPDEGSVKVTADNVVIIKLGNDIQ